MVERTKITLAFKKNSEDLDLFKRAIEKTGAMSPPATSLRPRSFMAARAGIQHGAPPIASGNPSVMIGNWFWNIG